jgi:hypothetical protein
VRVGAVGGGAGWGSATSERITTSVTKSKAISIA